jgi:hypothetical protein
MKKIALIVFLFALLFVFFLAKELELLEKKDNLKNFSYLEMEDDKNGIRVAICPTFYYLLAENNDIIVVKTDSTSESLKLIEEKKVNAVISGRALKKKEPELFYQIIGEGYDFIYKDEVIIFEEEMEFIPFFTDLDAEKIINDFQYISEKNLSKVENIYNYLEKGIIITFLEDKLIEEPVHILKKDGTRLHLSRRPRIYYLEGEVKDKIIANLLKN